jgi:cation:H+ antiporter
MIFHLLIFVISGMAIWFSGIILTKTTDALDCRFKIGEAFGGLILLGISGSLPDIAIAISGSLKGHMSIVIGNLIGGISIQTLLIALFDFRVRGKRPLAYLAGSITLFFETVFSIILIVFALVGTYVPAEVSFFKMNPFSIMIVVAWFFGLYLIDKSHKIKRFNQVENGAHPGRMHTECHISRGGMFYAEKKSTYVIILFTLASIITLIAGFFLEESGNFLAGALGMSSGIFAATILALVTSLPEISTGLEAIFIGDNHLAISDVLGGNAFMLVPFFATDLILEKPVLSYAQNSDRLFLIIGVFMLSVYAFAFLIKPRKRYFNFGLDSIVEIFIYAGGLIALFYFKLI